MGVSCRNVLPFLVADARQGQVKFDLENLLGAKELGELYYQPSSGMTPNQALRNLRIT